MKNHEKTCKNLQHLQINKLNKQKSVTRNLCGEQFNQIHFCTYKLHRCVKWCVCVFVTWRIRQKDKMKWKQTTKMTKNATTCKHTKTILSVRWVIIRLLSIFSRQNNDMSIAMGLQQCRCCCALSTTLSCNDLINDFFLHQSQNGFS